jgi:hypothetical protein
MTKKLVLLLALVASGCSHYTMTSGQLPYAPDELYQGYPCAPNCEVFKAGFDQAQKEQYKTMSQCPATVDAQAVGCKAYVKEFQIEHKSFEELINGL